MKKKIALLACGWCNYYLEEFIAGMKRAATEDSIDIYVFNAYNYTEFSGYPNSTGYSIYGMIHYEDFDGIIILSDLINNPRVLEKERLRIIKSGKPAIAINKKMEGITNIRVDNYTGFHELIEHMLNEHNIRDFGYITGRETSIDIAERYKAFRVCLTEHEMKIDMTKVFEIAKSDYHTAYSFMTQYVENGNPLPECFVCANDLIALAVMKVAQEHLIDVPGKLKIIGYDDIFYAKSLIPSITTVKGNAELIGYEALKRVLTGSDEVQLFKLKSTPIYRHSCGCEKQLATNQKLFSLNILDDVNKTQAFSTQMEKIEEIFTEAPDVFTLLTNLELFFNGSHTFEGRDFCIFLKADWSSVLINSSENLPLNLSYGSQVQSIVSIQGDKKFLREVINTRELIPSKMKTDTNNVFLFMPIFHHSYVHGYLVCKNNLAMLDNHFGYTWTKTFGNSIERFRTKNMYKQMSQQYLKLSTRDALSGMLNRVGLEKLAKPFYAQNKKNGLTTVLFFVDINKMKTINDKFGHLHGDLAVKTISAAAMEVVPKNWLCIRYGGDEFLIVGNSKNYNGEDYCTLIKQRVAKKTAVMQLPYDLSASVGTLSVPANSTLSLEEAVSKVDEIMYAQKQAYHKAHQ